MLVLHCLPLFVRLLLRGLPGVFTRSARCVLVSVSTGVQLVVADANHCARAQHVETTGQIYDTSYC